MDKIEKLIKEISEEITYEELKSYFKLKIGDSVIRKYKTKSSSSGEGIMGKVLEKKVKFLPEGFCKGVVLIEWEKTKLKSKVISSNLIKL